jgi:hypothetical protein
MNISFVLPFYKKADLFRMILQVNRCFRVDGVEVVAVLDEPSEERQVLEIVEQNKDVRFRVIVNDWAHPWRPPCIPINVGIRHALADHVVIASPESAIVLPWLEFLQDMILADYRTCYSGICWMTDDFKLGDSKDLLLQKIQVAEAVGSLWNIGTGFLLAPKLALERVCGMDESRTTYGLDDNDLRIRLARLGYRITVDGRIKVFHAPHDSPSRVGDNAPLRCQIRLFDQEETWGRAFNRVAWDWNKK